MRAEEAIDWIVKNYESQERLCVIIWTAKDVLDRAEVLKIDIVYEEAAIVLENIERNHDACIGVSWDTIDSYLESLYGNRSQTC